MTNPKKAPARKGKQIAKFKGLWLVDTGDQDFWQVCEMLHETRRHARSTAKCFTGEVPTVKRVTVTVHEV